MNKVSFYSNEAEQSLLHIILLHHESSLSKIIGHITEEDFFNKYNKFVFRGIEHLYNQKIGINVVNILDYLSQYPEKSHGEWHQYLQLLLVSIGIETDLEEYIATLKDKTLRRTLKDKLDESMDKLEHDRRLSNELVSDIENKIFEATREREVNEFKSVKELTSEFVAILEKKSNPHLEGYKTGYPKLDKLITGFKNSNLIIIGARPSIGKTAVSLQFAKIIAEKFKVAFFSIEMPSSELLFRLYSSETMFETEKIRDYLSMSSRDRSIFDISKEKISKLHLVIDDTPGISINEIMWKARKLKHENNLDIIFIDYLQIIQSTLKNRDKYHQISEISRLLKQMARELDVPVVALCQLSRAVEKRDNKKPIMSDIRESGAIEQDADLIMFLHNISEGQDENNVDSNTTISELEISIAKNRNGQTGHVSFDFNKSLGIIKEKKK